MAKPLSFKISTPPQAPSKDRAKTKTKEKHVDALFSTQAEFHVLPQTVILLKILFLF